MFGSTYFGRALFGGDQASTAQSVFSAAGSGVASFVSVAAPPAGVLAAAGSGAATFLVFPVWNAAGSGSFAAVGGLLSAFKPEWAANSNRVYGPPSPGLT